MKIPHIILRSLQSSSRDIFASPLNLNRIILPPTESNPVIEVENFDKKNIPKLMRLNDVVAVAPAMPMKLIAPIISNSPVVNGRPTWGVTAVGADTSPFTGKGIIVAVLDTGINTTHPAFSGIHFIEGDFTGEGNGDLNGHGTHCCGTICGRNVNNTRIGVAPGVETVLCGKVLGENGGGSSEQISQAILWAVDNGANVISMSLGMDFPGYVDYLVSKNFPIPVATSLALEGYRANVKLFETLASLVKARSHLSQATLIVAAAGNESKGQNWEIAVSPPAVADGIISVAALEESANGFTVASFSNTGANISAPGVNILSADHNGGLISFSGTSMATPHVAGVAALWAEKLQKSRRLTSFDLTGRLVGTSSTSKLNAAFDPNDVGAGLVLAPQN